MKAALSPSAALPTIPAVAVQLLDAFSNPDAPISDIVDIVKKDPAITAKLLKAANSLYGGATKIETVDRAVVWMGKHVVSCLALSFSLVDSSQHASGFGAYFKDLWLQSVIQALAMEWLAKRYQPDATGAAFVAGLLADVGRLALMQNDPSAYAPLMDRARRERRRVEEIELEELGKTHVEVTAELLDGWSLPNSLITTAQNHALSVDSLLGMEDRDHYAQIGAANVAAATADFLTGFSPAESFDRLQILTSKLYGFSDEQIDEYISAIRERLSETSELFSTDVSQMPSTAELLASAMEQLAHFSLRTADSAQPVVEEADQLEQENEELRKRINELEKRTSTDGLTRVYNRDYFCSRLNQRLQNRGDSWMQAGVLFVDADKFKNVNATYGHLVGDEVLKTIASLMQSTLRETDVVARYGGEEFVALLDSPDAAHVELIAERIRECIAEATIRCGDHELAVTVSIGGVYAAGVPEHEIGPDFQVRLLDLADKAMYEAKQNGRNRVVIRELICQSGVSDHKSEPVASAPQTGTDAAEGRESSICT